MNELSYPCGPPYDHTHDNQAYLSPYENHLLNNPNSNGQTHLDAAIIFIKELNDKGLRITSATLEDIPNLKIPEDFIEFIRCKYCPNCLPDYQSHKIQTTNGHEIRVQVASESGTGTEF